MAQQIAGSSVEQPWWLAAAITERCRVHFSRSFTLPASRSETKWRPATTYSCKCVSPRCRNWSFPWADFQLHEAIHHRKSDVARSSPPSLADRNIMQTNEQSLWPYMLEQFRAKLVTIIYFFQFRFCLDSGHVPKTSVWVQFRPKLRTVTVFSSDAVQHTRSDTF